ncbi:MAG: aromatic-ring-hydroxylating dioxygenase subunit beta, partial [Tistlia sp.]|uniref:aromatic-ring-hydroxylating dioxygenase subunit beta n=1 Tax=Tistlia sp. TaxID=3057121 RepID=UPI0034A5B555
MTTVATTVATQKEREVRALLRDLNDDYAVCLDDMELARWPDFFEEEADYRVVSRENHEQGLELSALSCTGRAMLLDRVAALESTTVYEPRAIRHLVGCVTLDALEGELCRARANFALYESLSDREPHLLMVGRYLDVVSLAGERPLFRQRWCVYDNYRIRTSLIIPV